MPCTEAGFYTVGYFTLTVLHGFFSNFHDYFAFCFNDSPIVGKKFYHVIRMKGQIEKYKESGAFGLDLDDSYFKEEIDFKLNWGKKERQKGYYRSWRNTWTKSTDSRRDSRMDSLDIVLTIISVLGTLSSILFAYLAFKRGERSSHKDEGKNEGVMLSEIGYIKSSIDRIEKSLNHLEERYSELSNRLVKVEESTKNAQKRITELHEEMKGGNNP